jgi:NADPH:quinone reductase-like Zn-dependent oxidoreductase
MRSGLPAGSDERSRRTKAAGKGTREAGMRVMEIRDEWGLDNLKQGSRADPAPAAGEVVVQIEAASVNYRDLVMADRGYGRRSGELPLVPVSDGAGTVVATGPGVTRVAVGDLVCPTFAQTWIAGPLREDHWMGMLGGPRDGVLQERMLLDEDGLVKLPPHLDAVHAAALPCAAVTAWNAVVVAGRTRAGDTVLTQGTGGVSLFALQFAKALGARVIVTSSRHDKLARARQLGADETINYADTPDWGRRAREIAGPDGIDLVLDLAGLVNESVRTVRTSGTVALVGVLAGGSARFDLGPAVTREIRLRAVTAGSRHMFEDMLKAITLHRLVPAIEVAPQRFDEADAVIRSLTRGGHFGKICMRSWDG